MVEGVGEFHGSYKPPKSSGNCSGLASYAYLISHFATKFKTWFNNGDREIRMGGEMGNEWGEKSTKGDGETVIKVVPTYTT